MLPPRMIIDRIGRHFSRADDTHGRGRRLQMITPRGRYGRQRTRRRRRPRQPCHLRGTGARRPPLLVVFIGLATAPRRSRRWGRPRRPGGDLLLLLRGPAAVPPRMRRRGRPRRPPHPLLSLHHGRAYAPGHVRRGGRPVRPRRPLRLPLGPLDAIPSPRRVLAPLQRLYEHRRKGWQRHLRHGIAGA